MKGMNPLSGLGGAREIVSAGSIVIVIVLVCTTAVLSQAQRRAVRGATTTARTQRPAIQPPINVTVVAPSKTPEELADERRDREGELATQVDIGRFTMWLVVVGGLQ